MRLNFLIPASFIIALFTAQASLSAPVVTARFACPSAFSSTAMVPSAAETEYRMRLAIVEAARKPAPPMYWVQRLANDPRFIFSGEHGWIGSSEFLASNESGVSETPYDGKHADVLIAFGTNAAWDIAVNQSTDNIVFVDWSPFPILAQAYLIAPLLRISKTSTDFIRALAAHSPGTGHETVKEALERYGDEATFEVPEAQVRNFLYDLAARPQITSEELLFISSFFWNRSKESDFEKGPFAGVREAGFTHFVWNYKLRYENLSAKDLEKSALHNPVLYQKLRKLFDGHVRYAYSEITNLDFYKTLRHEYPRAKDWTMSITNIFNMPYLNYNYRSLRLFLSALVPMFQADRQHPLKIFRTWGEENHRFLRYDLFDLETTDRDAWQQRSQK